MSQQWSSLRLLAPVALVVFGLTLFAIVVGSGSSTPTPTGAETAAGPQAARDSGSTTTTRERSRRRSYTVEPGDTLGAIAEETGVSVQALQDLNPDLDPHALVTGQRLKLRE